MSRVAVLDANILIPAALRDLFLRLFEHGLYQAFWSERILAEIERNLVAAGMTTPARASRLVATMRDVLPQALISGFDSLIDDMPVNSHDRHIVAAAVAAGADTIVTMNVRHFPAAALRPLRIAADLPDDFLREIDAREPDLVTHVIYEQARDLHAPSLTVPDVLAAIGQFAPRFAHDVARRFR